MAQTIQNQDGTVDFISIKRHTSMVRTSSLYFVYCTAHQAVAGTPDADGYAYQFPTRRQAQSVAAAHIAAHIAAHN